MRPDILKAWEKMWSKIVIINNKVAGYIHWTILGYRLLTSTTNIYF